MKVKLKYRMIAVSLAASAILGNTFLNAENCLKPDAKIRFFRECTAETEENEYSTENIIKKLCSDEFEGRLAGTKGNEKTSEYIAEIFKKEGIEPFKNNSYYMPYSQKVYENYKDCLNEEGGEIREINNVIGKISGIDKDKALVISAHFDHIGRIDGFVYSGALDNVSGTACLIKTAELLKNSLDIGFKGDIIFAAFNGEETGCNGSKEFVRKIKNDYKNVYNINIDCVGGKKNGRICLKNFSTLAESEELKNHMKEIFDKNKIKYTDKKGDTEISDHKSFEAAGFPNICISQEKLKYYIHVPHDMEDSVDCAKIDKIAESVAESAQTFKL